MYTYHLWFPFQKISQGYLQKTTQFLCIFYIDMLVYNIEDINLYEENVLCRSVKRNCTLLLLIKGNNKITDHRAIFQRERQNS